MTLILNNNASAIDKIESSTAVRKIISNDTNDGNVCIIPPISIGDWCVCIYIPARAGPIELPTILISIVVPRDIPINSFGVVSIMTFIAPTLVKDNPTERSARFADIKDSLEWNVNKPKKLIAVIIEPAIIDFSDPNFDIMNPEEAPKTNSTTANGNCTSPALIASSPKPRGSGFLTKIGIV